MMSLCVAFDCTCTDFLEVLAAANSLPR